MSPLIFFLAAVVIFATHYLGAIATFGSTLLSIPILLWLREDLEFWIVIMLLVGTVQCYQVFFYVRRHANRRELLRIVIWCGLALPIGLLSQNYLPEMWLRRLLGAVLVFSGVSKLMERGGESRPLPPWLGRIVLIVAGVIHGAFTCGGSVLVLYAGKTLPEKHQFRGTIVSIWVILNTVLIVSRGATGQISGGHLLLALGFIPIVFLASYLGQHTAEKMRQESFIRLVAVMLVVAGVVTIVKTLA